MSYVDRCGREKPADGYFAGNLPVGSLVTWAPGVSPTVEIVEQHEARTVVRLGTGRREDIAVSTIVWFDDPYLLEDIDDEDDDVPGAWDWDAVESYLAWCDDIANDIDAAEQHALARSLRLEAEAAYERGEEAL